MSRKGKILRPVLRFVASVLITSGLMMLVDAGLTVTWQEPVSAFIAAREQGDLEGEMEGAGELLAAARADVANEKDVRKRVRRLAAAWRRHLDEGDAMGRIELPTLDRDYVIVEGTKLRTLRKGPGHYPKTPLPGEGGTVGIAGHRTTYGAPFRSVNKLKAGDELIVEMPYGRFTYRVDKLQIVPPTATWITNKRKDETLVLSACHPLYSAAKRIVVFSTLVGSEPK